MDEFISRKAAIAYIREQSEECQKAFEELGGESGIYADAYNDLAEDFYSIPAADVAPVVHGRWICINKRYGEYECSVCHGVDANCSDYYGIHAVTEQEFCPNCGAKMDKEETNELDKREG